MCKKIGFWIFIKKVKFFFKYIIIKLKFHFYLKEELFKPEDIENLREIKQRCPKNSSHSAMKSIKNREISDKENILLSVAIDTVKESFLKEKLEESRKSCLEYQRESSKMCTLM